MESFNGTVQKLMDMISMRFGRTGSCESNKRKTVRNSCTQGVKGKGVPFMENVVVW